MYNDKNLIHIFTILECIEKCWIYLKDYKNASDFYWENEQRDLNTTMVCWDKSGAFLRQYKTF